MSARTHPIRVLLAKPGLDGHDRGVKVIARALRDSGMEVIYLGLRTTPEAIARAAVQEDVDVIGVSNLSGAYGTLLPAVADALRDAGVDLARVVLFGGGTIPPDDHARLEAAGYRRIFAPGSSLESIAAYVEKEVPR